MPGSKPLIWRRVVVNKDLKELHNVIQIVMPWTDSHLHCFYNKNTNFTPPYEEFEIDDLFGNLAFEIEAYQSTLVGDFFKEKRDVLHYEYDFGDC